MNKTNRIEVMPDKAFLRLIVKSNKDYKGLYDYVETEHIVGTVFKIKDDTGVVYAATKYIDENGEYDYICHYFNNSTKVSYPDMLAHVREDSLNTIVERFNRNPIRWINNNPNKHNKHMARH